MIELGVEKMDPHAMSRSLTGYDEIAIKKAFGGSFENLEGMLAGRSLCFIQFRRNGAKDPEALKAAMEMTVGELQDLFDSPDAEGNESGSTTEVMTTD